ncbi:DNA polymerase III subunit gamma/tau [Lapidilactobacillus salsurivasis]
MAYQALYRVWRPQTFAQVIGQKIVTQTLRNAIITDQISHAYLFAGPRGTGKTSCAKIFAKAVNCLHPVDGEPCNQCAICQAVNENRLTDVIEIDAASNNGVDEIRDIRDKVKYPPTEAKYKVYIIDEVHMLSTGAFNALLKTLEEPPAHVIFILATTELQKVPATIISRTQRFSFRRIVAADLTEQMVKILTDKQITYDPEALDVISRAADGGMRDALSILDQVLSFGQDHVSLENALEVTGDASDQQLAQYLVAIFNNDLDQALKTITSLFMNGRAAARLIEGVIALLRNLLLQKSSPELLQALDYRALPTELLPFATQIANERLYRMIDQANETLLQLRTSAHSDLFLEVLTVRFVTAETEVASAAPTGNTGSDRADPQVESTAPAGELTQLRTQVQELAATVARLQQQPASGGGRNAAARPTSGAGGQRRGTVKINREAVNQVLAQATRHDLDAVQNVWPDMLDKLSPAKRAMMKVAQPVAASPAAIVVAFTYAFTLKTANGDQSLQADLKSELNHFMNNDAEIVLVEEAQWPKLRQEFIQQHRAKKQKQPVAPPAAQSAVTAEGKAAAPQSAETAASPDQAAPLTATQQAQQLFGAGNVTVKQD